jgi:hypothetical protein
MAMGCILYELATHRKAFKNDAETAEYSRSKKNLDIFLDEGFSEDCKEKITRNVLHMLQIEASLRPSTAELLIEFDFHCQISQFYTQEDAQVYHDPYKSLQSGNVSNRLF